MQTDFYKKYIKSHEWEEKKQERMKIDGYKCVMCGRPQSTCKRTPLQCHHITYKNLGHEDVLADLVTLCPQCHIKIHRYYNRRKKENAIAVASSGVPSIERTGSS